jgi:polysaccharide deacetylase family protein (PEP-CTERM system associated)
MTSTTRFRAYDRPVGEPGPVNAMTVDVEDYFQVSAFERTVARDEWEHWPRRVQANTDRVLAAFDRGSVKATFFVLGWVAERHPDLVRRIVDEGHELGSHGWAHVRVVHQEPDEFRQDVDRTKKLLEDISGVAVHGYRAASYSIGRGNLWALDVLRETGHRYSSSVFPIRHDLYGMPEAPRFPFHPGDDEFVEIPLTTVHVGGRRLPCAGGGWFRFFPYAFSRWAIRRVNEHDRQPAIFYFHPWEVDVGQPRPSGLPAKSRFRHYLNLHRMEPRLERLIRDFRWGRVDRVFGVSPAGRAE